MLPKANIPLFYHFVSANKHGRWDCQADRFGSFQVDQKLEFSRQFNRQVSRPFHPSEFCLRMLLSRLRC
jgi:hypothetical protein